MPAGITEIDFGAGSQNASFVVTGQAGILATSKVGVIIQTSTSADHTEDGHMLMFRVTVFAAPVSKIVVGTGFTMEDRKSVV